MAVAPRTRTESIRKRLETAKIGDYLLFENCRGKHTPLLGRFEGLQHQREDKFRICRDPLYLFTIEDFFGAEVAFVKHVRGYDSRVNASHIKRITVGMLEIAARLREIHHLYEPYASAIELSKI